MRSLGIIPARGGSKGVPAKNIRPVAGEPLICHSIRSAAGSSRLTRAIVSTDDEEIAQISRAAGADVPFMRPPHLATDDALAIDVLQHSLSALEEAGDPPYDAVVMLQPTTPFRSAQDIDGALELLSNAGSDSVISVIDVAGHHPARMKYLEGDRLIDPPFAEVVENQPRQQLRPMYIRNGAIYATRRDVLLAGSLKGEDSRAWVMSRERSVNIDDEDDLDYATWLAERAERKSAR